MGFRHVVKHAVQLLVGQNLRIGLGPFAKFRNNLRNFLGGRAEIGRNLLQSILH